VLLKRLSQLSVAILLFSVLAISFHYHNDLADQRYCPVCKHAKSLSSAKKPAPLLLSCQIYKTFHDLSTGEQPVPLQLPLAEFAKGTLVPSSENCRQTHITHYIASRASPVFTTSMHQTI
jgi:hypothetical protein